LGDQFSPAAAILQPDKLAVVDFGQPEKLLRAFELA
jgi:hypothetical protein